MAKVSPSRITNLRHTGVYKNSWVNQTKPSLVICGNRNPCNQRDTGLD